MIYISYYTKNTPYELIINEKLLPSLIKWNLPYDIESIEHLGSWGANTHYKATFLKKMLLKHKQSIVFIDADTTIELYPVLFDTLSNYDIGLHYLDTNYFWRGQVGLEKREALSGTLYLNYNNNILAFLDEWIEENKRLNQLEQKNMQAILEKFKDKLNIFVLPIEYTAIMKKDNKLPDYIKNPVIIHYQASRDFKNWNRK
jgi:hypothetical protein